MYETITKEKNTGKAVTLGIGTCANVGALLGRRYITKDYGKKVGQIRRKIDVIKMDLAKNEPISAIDEEMKLRKIKGFSNKVLLRLIAIVLFPFDTSTPIAYIKILLSKIFLTGSNYYYIFHFGYLHECTITCNSTCLIEGLMNRVGQPF